MSPERVFRREKRPKIVEEKVDILATSRPRAMRRSSIFSLKGEKDLTAQLSVAMDEMEEDEEEKKHEWPTERLKNRIRSIGVRYRKSFFPLTDAKDVTTESADIAKAFQPRVELSGLELRSELRESWGGLLYRALANEEDTQRCLQYVYIWTKQKWFVSLWHSVLPAFFLGFLGVGLFSYLGQTENFWNAMISVGVIGLIFLFAGVLPTISSYWKHRMISFRNSTWFILFASIWLFLILEIVLRLENALVGEISFGKLGLFQQSIIVPYVSWILLIIGLIFLFLYVFQPNISAASHEMDYAPIWVYVRQANGAAWKLQAIRYDEFHYYTDTAGEKYLREKGYLYKNTRPLLVIDNNWHSFEPVKDGRKRTALLGLFVLFASLTLFASSFFVGGNVFYSVDSHPIWTFLVWPVLGFIGSFLFFARYPTPLAEVTDLDDPKHQFTEDKLKILWNLKGHEPPFKIRMKAQDPFNLDEDFWSDFRDSFEDLIWYAFEKIEELEKRLEKLEKR